ncbi:MAG: YkgJ family cysteine cluster protein [Chitinophagaceae bacterium]|nr:YkgJ family cysteine cluster protein [Chitinophagaceae bacterium]
MPFSLRSFKHQVRLRGKILQRYLTRLEKNPPRGLDNIAARVDTEVWKGMDCLSCGNCCKSMTPTFKRSDIVRISAHLGMTPAAFKNKWLVLDDEGKDLINKKQPCQFLDMRDNKCSIYEVRPADCAGFPYLKKRKMTEYMHVHKQNIEFCPATFNMVERMIEISKQ